MAFEKKPGDGVLFPNDRKETENQPDFTGDVVAHRDIRAGETLRLAGWRKDTARGKLLSLKMSDVRGASQDDRRPARREPQAPLNDDIPW